MTSCRLFATHLTNHHDVVTSMLYRLIRLFLISLPFTRSWWVPRLLSASVVIRNTKQPGSSWQWTKNSFKSLFLASISQNRQKRCFCELICVLMLTSPERKQRLSITFRLWFFQGSKSYDHVTLMTCRPTSENWASKAGSQGPRVHFFIGSKWVK